MKAVILAVLIFISQPLVSGKASRDRELECLATNIYYEARGESNLGKLAVAQVTINRAANSSICKEVYRPYQFSWANTNKDLKYTPSTIKVAYTAVYRTHPLSNFKATHYHNTSVSPYWNKSLKRITQIGNHIFYA